MTRRRSVESLDLVVSHHLELSVVSVAVIWYVGCQTMDYWQVLHPPCERQTRRAVFIGESTVKRRKLKIHLSKVQEDMRKTVDVPVTVW